MIRFISDLHGQDNENFAEYVKNATEDDLLIILGDVGLCFEDTDENRSFTEYFKSLRCKIAFVDGNHENFDYLYSFPEKEWCGGRVHRITDNIVHLMRGYIFELEGKKFFVFGGCKSSQKWFDRGLRWEQEVPTADEISRGYETLKKCGNKVDYVLTHKYRIEPDADPMSLERFIAYIDENVEFGHWYCGHWHKSKALDELHTVVYKNIIDLE